MLKSTVFLMMTSGLLVVAAAPLTIGTAKSTGDFRVDGATIRGNTTVFDGSLIETSSARSTVDLHGLQITLSPDSRAKLYLDRIVLEKGMSVMRDAEKQVIEAATLRISSPEKGSLLQVEMSGPNHVAVSARSGSAEVRNGAGVLVASLHAGMALAFDPQAGAATASKLTGIVETRNGKYFLTDTTTRVTAELQGTELSKYVNKKVEITGSTIPGATAAAGASQVVQVTAIKALGKSKAVGAGAAGAGAAAAGAAGAGAAAGISTVATVAIVGGVAVGGTVGGLAAAGTFSDSAPVSRQ